jgi:putative glutamine amidotransferase
VRRHGSRRLASALGGDHHAAEDLRQKAFARAWRSLPRDLDPPRQRAWLRRTAANLAVDELRRRRRRPAVALEAAAEVASATAPEEPDAAREALATLGVSDRRILLLRFSAGFRHAEIARAHDSSEEAARKRVARARRAFLTAYRAARRDPTPLVLVISRDEPLEPYAMWLERAGARVRRAPERASERDLVLADALLLTGAFSDLHSELYGERPRALRGVPDLEQDRNDLALMRTALTFDLPIVGVCRGHQLLNIASGGTLYQDVVMDGVTGSSHDNGEHPLDTDTDSATRRLLGRSAEVTSTHHQAVRRLGRGLHATAASRDGVIEMIERRDRRFALGLQWHPETASEPGDAIAQALVEAAA